MAKSTAKAKKADVQNLADMSRADLAKALAEKQQDLLQAKQSHRAGELVNPRALTALRKDIARINTALNALTQETK